MPKQQALAPNFMHHSASHAASAPQAVRQLLRVTARYWNVRELRAGMPALPKMGGR